MTSSLTRGLTRILNRPVDGKTRHRAALHLIDWIGCAFAGSREGAGRILAEQAAAALPGGISLIGARAINDAEEAAFLNGGLGNVFEMDDVHRAAILHPGPVTIPAALAAAEAGGVTGQELLDAIVRGYEAVIRLGAAVGPAHYSQWHNTATCGPFGSAAAVASLLKLKEDAIVWALGNAGTQASGPWRCRHEDVMTKQLHTARAARAGYSAAWLASLGFTGPEFILEGEQGFFAAMCPDGRPEDVLLDPDAPWKVWETSFKPWPACRHAHPAIDAALLLRDSEKIPIDSVKAIEIATYGDAKAFCDRARPVTTIEAKFSLQHGVALVLLDGPPTLSGFATDNIQREDIAALREKSTVTIRDDLDAAYPQHFGSEVRIVLRSGETKSATVLDALGDPENPLPTERLIAKAEMLMTVAGVKNDGQKKVIDACLALANSGPLSDLTDTLQSINASITEDPK
ncbi:MAG: MmgE/PrpD family protein [Pseudomonadota bacterium]